MTESTFKYLTQIINTPSPSGYESIAQRLFKAQAEELCLETSTDALGNIAAHIPSIGKPKLLISAHIDEIGMVVKHIDENGFVYVVPIGGIDKMLIPGTRLTASHGEKHYLGICGRKPIHLLSEKERNVFDWEDLWVDFGFNSRKHALEHISIGDPVVFNSDIIEMTDSLLVTRSADNKVGNAVLVELMVRLKNSVAQHKYDIYLCSTVQEEIGLRGAMVATHNLRPDYCLIIDAAHATDYPGTNPRIHGEIKLGCGPVIATSPDTDHIFVEKLIDFANQNGIAVQRDVNPNASGTEAKAMQLQCGGVSVATISYPVRYMHSPSEIFSTKDVDSIISLIEAYTKD